MKKLWVLAAAVAVAGVVGMGEARGQVDERAYREAMERLAAKGAAAEGRAATQQAPTRPTTREAGTTREGRGGRRGERAGGGAATTQVVQGRYAGPATRGSLTAEEPPGAPREFRGVWVSSVNNGVWPSRAGLSADEQKREMLAILDRCAAMRANAVVFQVRPCADALYKSDIEPWSEYMTGVQGQAPEPAWDPLEVWVEEAHKRGMELHAWFNPYRVKHASAMRDKEGKGAIISEKSIAKTHPEVVREYGGYLWMDPGEEVAAKQTLDVIADIVKRYDVDGVHTDDYYYPYQVRDAEGKTVEFPDEQSYAKYKEKGGTLERADWRRDNVNRLVENIYAETRKLKPWVKVGYAPFGIWKSNVPAGIQGLSQYDALYADAKLWLNKGWLDYMSPQLYWKIGGPQDYTKLLAWWVSENTMGRHVWPGLSVARHPVVTVEDQVEMTRGLEGSSAGVIHWNVNSVLRRPELYSSLKTGLYSDGALVPASPWLEKEAPGKPVVSVVRDGAKVRVGITGGTGEEAFVYGVWAKREGKWGFEVVPAKVGSVVMEGGVSAVVVSAVDRVGNESERVRVEVE